MKGSMMNKKEKELNSRIGYKIREIRKKKNMSQEAVANIFNISYQQVQKYESGKNRISAARLILLLHFMKVSTREFFEKINAT